MKIKTNKKNLLKALSHGQSVVEKRSTIPILSHILLSAKDNALFLTTTDMDMALIETIQASVEKSGEICISASLLYEIIKKLPDGEISFSLDDQSSQVVVTAGRARFSLPFLSSDDFPQITHSPLTHYFSFDPSYLKNMIDKTRSSMSTEEARYQLNGVHFHTLKHEEKGIYLRSVSTDMHRLACIDYPAPHEIETIPDIIIGRKTIIELRKLIEEVENPIKIGLSSSRIEFSIEAEYSQSILSSRLIDGSFPDYQSVLNLSEEKRLIVPTQILLQAVDRIGTVVTDKIRAIRFKISKNELVLSAISSESGSAIEDIDVDFPYDNELEICFNVRYVIDILHQIETEETEILLSNNESSVLMKPLGSSEHAIFVLMPMRI